MTTCAGIPLPAQLRAAAGDAGLDVLTARAGELERDFAFGIVRQLFEPLLATASADDREAVLSGAAALAAPLFDQSQLRLGDGASGDASFTTLHGLYWLAANIALRRPLLLAVDDLHWADQASLRWLGYLGRRLEGLPLLLAVATRPRSDAEASSMLDELLADPTVVLVRPRPLGAAAVAALVRDVLSTEPEEAFVAAAETASGGNPLFVRALLDAVEREHLAPTAANAARLVEIGPEAVPRAVSVRLSRLPEPARALLRASAILGDGADLALAGALAGLEPAIALTAATALVRAELLRQENPLEFTHPIVRTAIYEELPAADRVQLQRRAAELLLEAGAPPEQAATYLSSTLPANDQFVVDTLGQAAKHALAQGAPEAAIGYLRRAVAEPPPAAQRINVMGELGSAELQILDRAAIEHLREAVTELSGLTLRPEFILPYVRSLTMLASERSHEAFPLLEQLIDRVRAEPDLREHVAARLLFVAHNDPELYAMVQERWPELDQEQEHPIRTASLLAVAAFLAARRGVDQARAIALAKRAHASGLAGAEALYASTALRALTMAGEVEEAASVSADLIEVARRRGDQFSAMATLHFRARLRLEQGDLLGAEDDLTTPELGSSATRASLVYRTAYLAEALIERGALDEARRLFAGVSIDRVQPGYRIDFLCARASVELESGHAERALDSLLEAGAIAESLGIENPALAHWRSQAALVLQRLGRESEARELAKAELRLSRRWGAPRTVGISLRALGSIRRRSGRRAATSGSRRVLTESPALLEHARALIDLGAALRRANSRREARERLRAGIELAHGCGARALVERANEELAATGAHRRTIFYTGLEALTASERRVAQMAANGASNKEIAQELFVTVKTVEMHLGRVYRKLDVTSRTQLSRALARPEPQTA